MYPSSRFHALAARPLDDMEPVRVLMVEDDRLSAELVRELLMEGAIVTETVLAESIAAAVELLGGRKDFSLVLLDLVLPDGQGFETFTRVSQAAGDLPVIVLTSTDDRALAVRMLRAGARDYLVKSELSGPSLERAIRYVLEHRRLTLAMGEAESRLRLSEQRFAAQYDHAPIPTYTWRHTGGGEMELVDFNLAAETFSGSELRGCIGTPLDQFFADDAHTAALMRRCFVEQKALRYEAPYRPRLSVSERFVEVALVPVPPDLVLVQLRDLTSERIAEAALREREEELRTFTLSTSDVFCKYDIATGHAERSFGTPTVFGYRPEEIEPTAEWWWRRAHPDDRQRARDAFELAIERGSASWSQKYRFQRADGSYATIRESVYVKRDPGGEPIRALITTHDISEHEETARNARDHEALLHQVFEALPVGVCIADRDGHVSYANPAAQEIWGDARCTALDFGPGPGIRWSESGAAVRSEEWPLRRAVLHGELVLDREVELPGTDPAGDKVILQSALPLRSARGEITGALVVSQDLTRRRKLENQLQQEKRVSGLGRIAAIMAHEFNNVLMGIQPYAELVQRLASPTPRIDSAIEHIRQSVRRGKRITQEILHFTQPPKPSPVLFDVGKWLQSDPGDDVRQLAGGAIEVRIETPAAPVLISGDRQLLHQAIVNLSLNARDAMPSGGILTISLGTEELATLQGEPAMYARITVRDTGTGIPAAQLETIFEPLFTTKKSGTGLGLAVVHRTVSNHHGTIRVESTPGEGTAFHLFLPAQSPGTEPLPRPTDGPLLPRKLMLVEDDAMVATGLVLLLQSLGIEVIHRTGGVGTAEAVAEHAPDVLVLDVSLPDLPGTTVYEQIAGRYPDLPVIFSSGHGGPQQQRLRSNTAFLLKPYDLDALLTTCAELLRKKRDRD